jgi:hypothetical protein
VERHPLGLFAATASERRRRGKPVAFYSDKHSIFRVYREGTTGAGKGMAHFAAPQAS